MSGVLQKSYCSCGLFPHFQPKSIMAASEMCDCSCLLCVGQFLATSIDLYWSSLYACSCKLIQPAGSSIDIFIAVPQLWNHKPLKLRWMLTIDNLGNKCTLLLRVLFQNKFSYLEICLMVWLLIFVSLTCLKLLFNNVLRYQLLQDNFPDF